MDLDYPEQCLLCLEQIVLKPKVKRGYEAFEAKLENFQQLCEFLKVDFPLGSFQFKRILAEKNKKCCELLLCSKCLRILKDISGMYTELRRIEKRIDFAIRAVQEVIRKSEEEDTEEVGSIVNAVTSNEEESIITDAGGGGSDSPQRGQQRREEGSVVKRRKVELCGGVATSSIVADYREFVKTFRDLVKQVVTKEPEPGVLSVEADALSKIYQQLDDESGEVDLKPDISPPPSPAPSSSSDVLIIEQDNINASENTPTEIGSCPSRTQSVGTNTAPENPELTNKSEDNSNSSNSCPYVNDAITIFEVIKPVKPPLPALKKMTNGNSSKPLSSTLQARLSVAESDPRLLSRKDHGPSESTSFLTTVSITAASSTSPPTSSNPSTASTSCFNNVIKTSASPGIKLRASFTCRYCTAVFNSAVSYYVHRKEQHPVESEDLYIPSVKLTGNNPDGTTMPVLFRLCPICGEQKNPRGNVFLQFVEHMLSHEILSDPNDIFNSLPGQVNLPAEVDRPNVCDQCDQRFLLEMNLDLHKICYHESNLIQLKCDQCGDTSNKTWEDLVSHLVQGHGSHAIHSCKSCPMACSTADNLLEHMFIHTYSKRLPCSECNHVAPSLKELYQHFRECHPNLLTTLKCDTCRQMFLMPSTYRRHMATVHIATTPEPPSVKLPASTTITPVTSSPPQQPTYNYNIQCPHCLEEKLFKNQVTLDNHIRIHHDTTVNKHECNHCGKAFVHRSTLRYHIQQVHLGIRYACSYCPKSFTAQSLLKGHLKLHTSGKGHAVISCNECGKSFASMTALKTHQVTQHEPNKPVSCDICGRVFSNVYSLRGHKSEVHNFKPYNCPQCPQKFARLKQFNYHLSTHGIYPQQEDGEEYPGDLLLPFSMVSVETDNSSDV